MKNVNLNSVGATFIVQNGLVKNKTLEQVRYV